jgi:hypothetical protein
MADILCFEEYQRLNVVKHMPEAFFPETPNGHLERQGTLDGLCGVYCIVNAVSRVALLSSSERIALFKRLIRTLDMDQKLGNYLLNGMHEKQIKTMLETAQEWLKKRQRLALTVIPLFPSRKRFKRSFYLDRINDFTRYDAGVVVTGLEGVYHHWTCITGITPKTIRLLDSDGLHFLRTATCRISRKSFPRYHCLNPDTTWGLRLSI